MAIESRDYVVNLNDIVLVKSDSIMNLPSLRDQKIIRSLRKKYSINVLGWNREGTSTGSSHHETDLRLFNVRATYGYEPYGTLRYLPHLLIFWIWVFIKLCVYRPKIIHACNLDSIFPSYFYKILFRKKLVFDVFDRYAMAYIPKDKNLFFRMLYTFVNWVEEEFAKSSDVLINISDEILTTYRRRPKNCTTIMNCSEDHITYRSRVEGNAFRLLFTGHIRPGRGLEVLPDIVKNLKGTELIITGRIEDRNLLNKIDGASNIIYQGFLDHKEVLDLEANSDVMVALYDLNLQTQNKYVIGNKLFEAMMCGLPVVTNVAQDIVNETECGIIVEYDNLEQIKEAIIKLKDNPELRKRLGANGRKAFLEKYNWNVMEQRLYKVYDNLLSK
jgi:glycosyltransferase involved in cell wall biosynthesis